MNIHRFYAAQSKCLQSTEGLKLKPIRRNYNCYFSSFVMECDAIVQSLPKGVIDKMSSHSSKSQIQQCKKSSLRGREEKMNESYSKFSCSSFVLTRFLSLFSQLVLWVSHYWRHLSNVDPSEAADRSSATPMLLISGGTDPYPLHIIIHLTLEQNSSVSVEQTERC